MIATSPFRRLDDNKNFPRGEHDKELEVAEIFSKHTNPEEIFAKLAKVAFFSILKLD
jgi:hypothetical protein